LLNHFGLQLSKNLKIKFCDPDEALNYKLPNRDAEPGSF
jgi:hypothetical protein